MLATHFCVPFSFLFAFLATAQVATYVINQAKGGW